MLKDEEIFNYLDKNYNLKNENNALCFYCKLKLKEILKETDYFKKDTKKEKIIEALLIISIFEKNFEKIKTEFIKKELQGVFIRLNFNVELFKSNFKMIKIKNEKILEKEKEIINTIKKMQNEEKQEEKELNEKNLNGNIEVHKKFKNIMSL